jgi:crotonobetainyl-CoA:carnitine CoA-transferase CaiB-like acyl-CoA transferase
MSWAQKRHFDGVYSPTTLFITKDGRRVTATRMSQDDYEVKTSLDLQDLLDVTLFPSAKARVAFAKTINKLESEGTGYAPEG